MKVVVLGSGNVATHLSLAIQKTQSTVIQVYSRNFVNACRLAYELQTACAAECEDITPDADLYLFAVTDSALAEIIPRIPANKGIWVHTAGSVPMDIFKGYTEHYGVLYPLQTFSGRRAIDLQHVPFFVEANLPDNEKLLIELAGRLSNNVQTLDSEKRKYLHLAAVFACNFSNHMYALAYKLLEKQHIPPDVLLPLIDETAAKIHSISPLKAQTGPAIRNDSEVMDRQMELLSDPVVKELYQLISQHIYKEAKSNLPSVNPSRDYGIFKSLNH